MTPETVGLDPQLLKATIADIEKQLGTGLSAVKIPISDLLVKQVRDHFSQLGWEITTKEYQSCVKLRFRPKAPDDAITITWRENNP